MSFLLPTAKSDPELAPFRPGLVFAVFNALAWQIGIGTPMVLFVEQLGGSTLQVGLAYSFVFLLTPLQILATPLLSRFGFKRVMLGGWSARSLFLVVPVVLALLAMRGEESWMAGVLVGSVFMFCLCRSIGATAAVPWLYAILPPKVRGRYFSSDQFFSGVGGVGTLVVCSALFLWLPIYPALIAQYGIALTGSVLSFFALNKLPDAPLPKPISLRTVARDTPRHLFAPSPFRKYVWLAAWGAVMATPIAPFCAYYLKVVPQLPTGQIMLFEVLRYSGVIVAALLIRRHIDTTGARPFFLLALGMFAVVAAFWWLFLRTGIGGSGGMLAAYFLLGLAAASWNIANLNYLPQIVAPGERTLAVSIHGAVTAFVGGLSPVVWGLFMKGGGETGASLNVDVFQWFFISVIVSAGLLALFVMRLPEDAEKPFEPLVIGNAILRPFRAMTYLVSLIELPGAERHRAKPPGKGRDGSG